MSSKAAGANEIAYGAGGKYVAEGVTSVIGEGAWGSGESTGEPIRSVGSADELLQRGINDYTFISGKTGVLGKGKFSTVYRVIDAEGNEVALKHTPLYPHHPLIAARLLREPELLGQTPPHPCLVGVEGCVKTKSHFYLIETLSKGHISLADLELPISIAFAEKILNQLVSVVRDGLHNGARVCHRDLKAENVLIDPKSGKVTLLDLGLATHFSLTEPRLTTCCGSPALHSPEIIEALLHPPGAVRYYGPELDIWCIGLTVMALLIQRRYPIGTSHKQVDVMAHSVKNRLAELDEYYQNGEIEVEETEEAEASWRKVRDAIEGFLLIDGDKRMERFDKYDVGDEMRQMLKDFKQESFGKTFKNVTFAPQEIKYTLPLYLEPSSTAAMGVTPMLIFRNPDLLPLRKVVSYIKYLMRCAGILYHVLPEQDRHVTTLQCVWTLPPDSPLIPSELPVKPGFLDSIFGTKRSSSVPAHSRGPAANGSGGGSRTPKHKKEHCLRFWLSVEGETRPGRRSPAKTRSRSRTNASRKASSEKELEGTTAAADDHHHKRPTLSRNSTAQGTATTRTLQLKLEELAMPSAPPSTNGDGEKAKTNGTTGESSRRRTRSTSTRPHASSDAAMSQLVRIRISDARALSPVRRALDQSQQPVDSAVESDQVLSPAATAPALPLSSPTIAKAAEGVVSPPPAPPSPDEPQRGRRQGSKDLERRVKAESVIPRQRKKRVPEHPHAENKLDEREEEAAGEPRARTNVARVYEPPTMFPARAHHWMTADFSPMEVPSPRGQFRMLD